MAGKPTEMTKEELTQFATRFRKLADACDVALKQMEATSQSKVFVSGKPTAEQCYERIHSFVNNVIGEAFNPSPEKTFAKSAVDEKLEQAAAILDKPKKSPQKRKT